MIRSTHPARLPARQQGVVLLIALIVLIAMSLIGISMIRQGSSAQMIVGNLAFKEGTNAAADFGVEAARNWLQSGTPPNTSTKKWLQSASLGTSNKRNPDTLFTNNEDGSYVANGLSVPFDPTTFNWDPFEDDATGVAYVIHRLCKNANEVTGSNECIVATDTSSKGGTSYGEAAIPELQPYYRISVRVRGPRNVTTYVQALMY